MRTRFYQLPLSKTLVTNIPNKSTHAHRRMLRGAWPVVRIVHIDSSSPQIELGLRSATIVRFSSLPVSLINIGIRHIERSIRFCGL
jgi:hypothetical protein